jgi:hypothetical protein
VRKQFDLLRGNLRHPSIQAKKYDDGNDIWQGRVTRDYRFYFQIIGDEYVIIRIIPHRNSRSMGGAAFTALRVVSRELSIDSRVGQTGRSCVGLQFSDALGEGGCAH